MMKQLTKARMPKHYYVATVIAVFCAITLASISGSTLKSSAATPTCNLNATTSTFASTFSSASGTVTICLAAGNYGSFSGGSKSARVTITPQAGVAASAVTLNMPSLSTSTNNITFDGITINDFEVQPGSYKNITVSNSAFKGQAVFHDCGGGNTNIVFDHNTHDNIDPGTYEGRIHFPGSSSGTCGVTIENSHFSGGCADGIQSGADGVQIIGNEFTNIHQDGCDPAHTDSIQFYGGSDTVIRDNYFHNVEDCIMAPDGNDHQIIENNVCITSNTQYGFTLGGDKGSIINHNTIRSTGGGGGIRVNKNNTNSNGVGTIVTNNIVPNGGDYAATGGTLDYNYGMGNTAHSISGAPSFVGGTNPTTYAGYALTPTSPGHNAASDGTDIGINVSDGGDSGGGGGGGGTGGATYDATDLNNLKAHYGRTAGMTITDGDLNGDGAVNVFDLGILLSSYGA